MVAFTQWCEQIDRRNTAAILPEEKVECRFQMTYPVSCGRYYGLMQELIVSSSELFGGKWVGDGTCSRQPVDIRGIKISQDEVFSIESCYCLKNTQDNIVI